MMEKKQIVIVGAGFGGLYTFKELKKRVNSGEVEITIFNPTNYFTFSPMIHEVATGELDPELVVESIREIIGKYPAKFYAEAVTKVDVDSKKVVTPGREVPYDYLVLATGAKTRFIEKVLENDNVSTLKSLRDAIIIKNQIIEMFEKANCGEQCDLSFAVVGGGPTGVELISEIHEFIYNDLLRYYREVDAQQIKLHLVTGGKELIGYFDESQRKRAYDFLTSKGIEIHLDTLVNDISSEGLDTTNGFIKVGNIVWVPGVVPNYPEFVGDCEFGDDKRLLTDEYLRMVSHPEVFVVGDLVSGFPMLAYTATRQAVTAGKNLAASVSGGNLDAFKFTPQAKLISLGQNNALAEIFGVKMHGRLVWFLWRTVYLSKILSFKNKVKIALNWTFNLFNPRDIKKL